jgi:transposase
MPHVKKLVIANPKQVRIIAHAKIKTDTIDASVLAQLYASGFLPEVWIRDEPTQALRRQVTRRNQIVRQRSRLKNIIRFASSLMRRSSDTIDASVLAQLYASGFLPEVWIPDQPTQALRRQVTRRNQIVRQRSRLKNIIQSILHSHLIPSCPHADLCGAGGRAWLFHQVLPEDERLAVAPPVWPP